MSSSNYKPITKFFRIGFQALARRLKGPTYKIDDQIDFRALMNVAILRLFGLIRCILFGVKWSPRIKELIFIGPDVTLQNKKYIRFGGSVTIGKGVQINGLSQKGVNIGDRVSIGPYSIIEATGVITDIGIGCSIGADSGIGAFSFIGAAGGVWIGEKVIMGQRVSFHSENHNFERLDLPIKEQGVTRKGIIIEDDCWIGANVVFIDGSKIGHGSVIAAGSVVRGEIPPYSIAAGIPAQVIRSRIERESPHEK